MDALTTIDLPALKKFKSGKVREVYDLDDKLLLVASDRISAFDCIMPNGIPDKGKILNQLSAWWFERTKDVVKNHIVATDVADFPEELQAYADVLAGRSALVQKTNAISVECVARGYIIGSGWKDYQSSGCISGIQLRDGYQMADKLDEAIYTPADKAESGHDENITYADVENRIGKEMAAKLRDTTLTLYKSAAEYALGKGIIIADTKFEFGLDDDGNLILIDEILTPDSSRFWPANTYAPGQSPPSFDKQFVRDYLETLDWDKTPPAPSLPDEITSKTRQKYEEAFRLLTGQELKV